MQTNSFDINFISDIIRSYNPIWLILSLLSLIAINKSTPLKWIGIAMIIQLFAGCVFFKSAAYGQEVKYYYVPLTLLLLNNVISNANYYKGNKKYSTGIIIFLSAGIIFNIFSTAVYSAPRNVFRNTISTGSVKELGKIYNEISEIIRHENRDLLMLTDESVGIIYHDLMNCNIFKLKNVAYSGINKKGKYLWLIMWSELRFRRDIPAGKSMLLGKSDVKYEKLGGKVIRKYDDARLVLYEFDVSR